MNLSADIKRSVQKNVLLIALIGSLAYLIYHNAVAHNQDRLNGQDLRSGSSVSTGVDSQDTADSSPTRLRSEDLQRLLGRENRI